MSDLVHGSVLGQLGNDRSMEGLPGPSRAIEFFVPGIPRPKGSTRAFMPKGARFPVVTSDNKNLKPWAAIVAAFALEHRPPQPWSRAISVRLQFYLPRPKSLPVRLAPSHTKKPDIDKLARAVLDALTGIMWIDDAQITQLYASKQYMGAELVGVRVSTSALEEP